VYVDIDPVAVTRARQLLEGNGRATALLGDLRRPAAILGAPELRDRLDLSRPVAVLLISMLHITRDTDDPYTAVATLRDALAPGSALAISHASVEGFTAGQAKAVQGVYEGTTTPGGLRTRAGIERFFTGFDLVEPGLVWMPRWRPDSPDDVGEDPSRFGLLAGVGRKTG
jgi:hypothetical protein